MAFQISNEQKSDSGLDIGKILTYEINLFSKSFSNEKKYGLYNELSVLLEAGIPVKEALSLIRDLQKKQRDTDLFDAILKDVINGSALWEALTKSAKFSQYECYSMKIGEETATLPTVCRKLAMFYERRMEQRRIVIGALTYPAIVMSTAILVIAFMIQYVVPMFEDIFRQNKVELPMLTLAILKLSAFLKKYFFIGLVVAFALVLLFRTFFKKRQLLNGMQKAVLKIPVIGPFVLKIYIAQFVQAFALLSGAKVNVLESLQMVSKMIGFLPLQQAVDNVAQGILSGKSFTESLKESKVFEDKIVTMVKVAEETNQLEFIFAQLNNQYNQDLVNQSKMLSTFLEPFIILFVGIIIGTLLISMYLPMFQLSNAIH